MNKIDVACDLLCVLQHVRPHHSTVRTQYGVRIVLQLSGTSYSHVVVVLEF